MSATRRGSRILQGRVSNPSERGTVPQLFWPMLPEPNNFLALEETVGARRTYDIWSYVKSLTKFLYSSRYVFTKHPVQLKTVTTYFQNMFFSKRAPKQKGGCLDTLDTTTLDPPLVCDCVVCCAGSTTWRCCREWWSFRCSLPRPFVSTGSPRVKSSARRSSSADWPRWCRLSSAHGIRTPGVKFGEINLKFKKVRKSSRSTFSHNCYRKTLSILGIVTVFSARMLIGQRSPTRSV